MTPHAKRKLIHYWRRQIRPLLVLILVFTSFRSIIADWNDVPTGSMKPTIFDGDRIFVNKLAYGLKFPFTTWHLLHWSAPKAGEIVVFYSPANGDRLVKRVVGVPGDHVQIKNGRPFINGKPFDLTPINPDVGSLPTDQQSYMVHFFTEQLGDHAHTVAIDEANAQLRDFNPNLRMKQVFDIKLRKKGEDGAAEDEYFMMGDNRDHSGDSRVFGPVPRDQILGRANRIIFSLNYDNYYIPRGNRFFKSLP